MKNAFKKLFSFMLVAVMLVSVLPVTAMAATDGEINVKVKFVDGETLLAHATDKIDGYEAETGCEGWNLDAAGAAGWLAKEDLFIVDETVRGENAKWKISETYNAGPTRNEKGVWVYTVPMEKVEDTTGGEGEGEGGGEETPTYRDVTVNFVFGGKTIATAVKKDVDEKITDLTGGAVETLYKADNDYDKDYVVADTDKTYPIDSNNTCEVEMKYVGETNAKSKVITLMGLDAEGNRVKVSEIVIREGEKVPTLTTPSKSWKKQYANKYESEDGMELYGGEDVKKLSDFRDVYYAKYNSVSEGKDGLSKLNVYASLFSAGKHQENVKLFDVILEDNVAILGWLDRNNDRVTNALSNTDFAGYERAKDYFYRDDGTDKLADQNTLNGGDKTIYVRLDATEAKTAKVVLYIHSKVTDEHPDTEVITGYVKNGEVTLDDIWKVIKKEYKTNSKTKLDGLYSQATWDQKVDGLKPDAVKSLDIDNNSLFEVHVILTNASSNADTSNPKTGDSMFMVMTVMALSATALAGAYIYNKKWMVK